MVANSKRGLNHMLKNSREPQEGYGRGARFGQDEGVSTSGFPLDSRGRNGLGPNRLNLYTTYHREVQRGEEKCTYRVAIDFWGKGW